MTNDETDSEPGVSEEHDEEVDEESKRRQLDEVRENPEGEYLTTDHGVPVTDTDNSLKTGGRGPTIMEDFHFREKMTQFDHESIPERVATRAAPAPTATSSRTRTPTSASTTISRI